MTVKNSKSGTLYVIATPIGNVEDISHRAIKILKQIEVCAAEDTRKSRKLFNFFGIDTKLVSYHKYSEKEKLNSNIGGIKNLNGKPDLVVIFDVVKDKIAVLEIRVKEMRANEMA